jgi:poly(A) polymerase
VSAIDPASRSPLSAASMSPTAEPDQPQAHRPRSLTVDLPATSLDQNALRVISRLQRQGFEAYLVGGCVRDLMLGRRPKDFDVATSAHPRQVKRLFHNGRIIGKRFRLVHVAYGVQIVETATFRRAPQKSEDESADLLIVDDNEFGTAEEDARRRDFTINALFFNPQRREILDYVGGLEDLESGVLRTIGDARVRMAEDPVRLLRAIKFATRLGFRIDPQTWDAMCDLAPELGRSAKPRVLEEILRLLRSGTALGAFRMMRACGALKVILPSIDAYLGPRDDPDPAAHDRADMFWRLLEALDADVHAGNMPATAVAIAALFLRPIERAADLDPRNHAAPAPDIARAAVEVIDPFGIAFRLSRRDSGKAVRIIAQQRRFTQPSSKRFRPILFARGEDFRDALDLFRLRSMAWGQGWDVYESWMQRFQQAQTASTDDVERERKRRRRGGKRRKRGAGTDAAAPEGSSAG